MPSPKFPKFFIENINKPSIALSSESDVSMNIVVEPRETSDLPVPGGSDAEAAAAKLDSDDRSAGIQKDQEKEDLMQQLKKGVVGTPCENSHVDWLLKILQPYFTELPLCSKMLLNTKNMEQFEIQALGEKCKLVYFGIQ